MMERRVFQTYIPRDDGGGDTEVIGVSAPIS